jgi:hypothetical protein
VSIFQPPPRGEDLEVYDPALAARLRRLLVVTMQEELVYLRSALAVSAGSDPSNVNQHWCGAR